MREGGTLENVAGERPNTARATTPQKIFAQTNPLTQPRAYEGGFSFNGGSRSIMQPLVRVNDNKGQQVQQVPQHPFGQLAPVPDLGAIKEAMQELYGPGLRKICDAPNPRGLLITREPTKNLCVSYHETHT